MKIIIQQKLVGVAQVHPEHSAIEKDSGKEPDPIITPLFSIQEATPEQIKKAKRIVADFNDLGDDDNWLFQPGATLEMVIEE